jgi:hypothetical protein
MKYGLVWSFLCMLGVGCSGTKDDPTNQTVETLEPTTAVETGTQYSTETQSETGTKPEINYTVGVARIDTHGVRVDNQSGARPWVDITLELEPSTSGEIHRFRMIRNSTP